MSAVHEPPVRPEYVAPQRVASAGSYRQERIAAARPVAELRRALGADTIIGEMGHGGIR